MKLDEYEKIKSLSYSEYCTYLKNKYGKVQKKYGSKLNKGSDNGLFIHHIKEDEVANLSNAQVAKANDPSFQLPENLVYCNYIEHLFLHILIGKETAINKNLGLGGAFAYIIPEIKDYYENGNMVRDKKYYLPISECKETFNALLDQYNSLVKNINIVLDENQVLYLKAEKHLDEDGKALVVLGTGLGKTTTALQYIWKHGCRALVIGPNTLIKDSWSKYGEWVDTTTYSAFAKSYDNTEKFNYSKYGLVILDEAHHAGYDEQTDQGAKQWSKGIKYILDNKLVKVLGLTATPERSDDINISETLFSGCVCEGRAVEDAIEDGTIHPFSYITAYYDTDGIKKEYSTYQNKELVGQLDLAINNTPTVKTIFEKHMPKNKRKGIIFIQDISDKDRALDIFKNTFPNTEIKAIDSNMSSNEVAENRKWFEETDEGYLMAINMISEGAHYKGVNTLIMFRKTNSYLVFTQQIGRIITLARDNDPKAIVFDLVNNIENIQYNDKKIEKEKKVRHVDEIIRKLRKSEAAKSGQIIVADETRDIVKCIRALKKDSVYFFEDEEIEILKKWYQREGPNKVQAELKNIGYNRSLQSIIVFASKNNIHYRNKWTEEEDNILRTYYPQIGAKCNVYLNGRTEEQIKDRCIKHLHIPGPDHSWTSDEIEILKKYYGTEGVDCAKRLMDRTKESIKRMARMQNIPGPDHSISVVCIEIGKTFDSVASAARFANIDGKNIRKCLSGDRNTAGGYHWKYADNKGEN